MHDHSVRSSYILLLMEGKETCLFVDENSSPRCEEAELDKLK